MAPSRLLDRFVPPGLAASPDLRRRARVLIGAALAFCVGAGGLAALGWAVEGALNPRVAVLLVLAATAGATPFVLRRTGQLAAPVHLIAAGTVAVMVVNSYTLGGVRGSTLAVALVLCIAVHFLAGAAAASVWTAVSVVVIAGLVALSESGHEFPMALDSKAGPLMAGASLIVELGVVHALSWLYDAERRRAHDALDAALKEAEHANRELKEGLDALETFARTASHDLRGPAARTQMVIDYLLDEHGEELGDEARELVGQIRGESQRMRELIDDVLALERSKLAPLERVPIDFADVARELFADLVRGEPGRSVELVVPDRLPLSADRLMASVALSNLLANAWKYSSGEPDARIEVGPAGDDGLFVRDNGAGFDATRSGDLFEPFVRLHTPQEFPGNGVGLATVHRIAERHGGFVQAESQPGEGATFTLSFGPGGAV